MSVSAGFFQLGLAPLRNVAMSSALARHFFWPASTALLSLAFAALTMSAAIRM